MRQTLRFFVRHILPILLFVGVLFDSPLTYGQTSVWNGGNGFWNDSGNWTGPVPNSAAAVVLIDNGNALASAVTLNQDATVLRISIDSDDSLTIAPTFSLSLAGGGTINGSGTLLNQGTVGPAGGAGATVAVNVNNTGGTLAAGGSGSNLLLNGITVTGGTLLGGGSLSQNLQVNGGALNDVQLFNVTGTGSVAIQGTVTNGGGSTFTLGNGATLSGPGTLVNQGIVEANPFAGGTVAVNVNNTGGTLAAGGSGSSLLLNGITVTGGTLLGGGSLSQNLQVNGGALNDVQLFNVTGTGSVAIQGTVTNGGGSTFTLGNGAALNGSGTLVNQGTVGPDGGASATLAVTVNNSGGTLQGGTGGGVLTLDGHTVSLGILTGQFGGINGASLNNVQLGGSSADVVTLTDGSTFGIRNTVGLTVTNLGTLNLGSGGAGVTLNSLLTPQVIGGQLILTHGTLKNGDGTSADRFATIQGGGTLNVPVLNNGLIIANNASTPLVIAGDVTDPNGLSVLRAVDGGTLTIDPATVNGQLLTVDHRSTLNGIGTINVADRVANAGVVAPGLGAPGTLTIDGLYAQPSNIIVGTGALDFLLGGGQAGQYSVLDVNGFALFDVGSIVEAEFFNAFNPAADCGPTFGVCDSFDVLHVANGFETNGTLGIAGLAFQLPSLPNGLSWEELDLNNHQDLVLEIVGSGGAVSTPEPSSLLLLGSGLLIAFGVKKYLLR